jgi:site-specific DNA-cytosine methylase
MKKNSYITVTDQFCGAGGSSQGVRAISRSMGGGVARRYPSTNILITSPECTNHSLAKGKKRKNSVDIFTALGWHKKEITHKLKTPRNGSTTKTEVLVYNYQPHGTLSLF